MSENGEIYTAGKNFTLPPALTALTNSTSGQDFGNGDDYQDYRGILNSYSQTQVSLNMR